MRYAGAGHKTVQKMTMEEKSSLFGMLSRIEKVVSDTYAREAVPTLVHTSSEALVEQDLPALDKVASLEAVAAERTARYAENSNVIDVAARILARGESAKDAQEFVKMGDDVVLEKKVVGAENDFIDGRFPPEFYNYFEITNSSKPEPRSPLRVV